jgi:hypothetical protein
MFAKYKAMWIGKKVKAKKQATKLQTLFFLKLKVLGTDRINQFLFFFFDKGNIIKKTQSVIKYTKNIHDSQLRRRRK